MAVFISYSHRDRDFAVKLAARLVQHSAHVWIDQWELRIGDSLIQRIQEAIQEADALLVVLSQASIESEWCKKEISSGLLRELEEKRVIVLPILLEDCVIPLFLREKKYADFSRDFEQGISEVLTTIVSVTSNVLGRVRSPKHDVDWAIDWEEIESHFVMRVTFVERADTDPYSVLTEVSIIGDEFATKRYKEFAAKGFDWVERSAILEMIASGAEERLPIFVSLEDQFPRNQRIMASDPKLNATYVVDVTARRLGEDNGKDVLVNVTGQLGMISEAVMRANRRLTPNEAESITRLSQKLDAEARRAAE